MKTVEKFEQVLYPCGDLKVKFTVTFGTKTTNGNRLSSNYEKTYNSTKYNGISELTTITYSPSIYIVFSCFNKEEKTSEEVFISFPQLSEFKNFLNNSIDTLISKNVYTNKDINKEFSDLVFESNSLISNKKIFIIPQKIQNNEFFEDGVFLFCNDEDHRAEITLNNLITIYEIINSFEPKDLFIMSQNAYIISNSENNNSNYQSSSSSISNSSNNSSPFRNRNISLNNNSSKNNKPSGFLNRRSINKPDSNDDNSINNEEEIETIVEEPVKKSTSSGLKRRGISLSDIKKGAEEIDTSSIDEENDDINIEDDIKFD